MRLLLDSGANATIDFRDEDNTRIATGCTIAHIAALLDHHEVINSLIQTKHSWLLEQKMEAEFTPAIIAGLSGHILILSALHVRSCSWVLDVDRG